MIRTKSMYLALVAVLLSPMAANADLIDTIGDKDCFGTNDVCVEGLNLPGLASAVTADATTDPLPTDRLTRGDQTWTHTFLAGSYSSATLIFRTVGIADVAGPYDVFFDSVLVGTLPFDGFGHFLVETFSFAIDPTLLLDGMGVVGFSTDGSTADGFAIDYSELTAETVSVPEPGTLGLLGLGLLGIAARRRRKA